jgi:hypothetical protein
VARFAPGADEADPGAADDAEEIDAKEQRGADILNRAFEAKATVIMGSDGNRLVTAPGSVFHGNAPVDRPDETQS